VLRRASRRKSLSPQINLNFTRTLLNAIAFSTQGCVRSQQKVEFLLPDLFFKQHKLVAIDKNFCRFYF